METYQYVVIDKSGKQIKGTMEAADKDKVILALKAEGKIPIKVTEQNIFTKDLNINIGNPIKPRDLSIFCRQFHSIISAGVTVISALSMLSEQCENKVMKKAIKDIQSSVEKGETLAAAMKLHSDILPPILINMIEAGETSGSLEVALERMAVHFEKSTKLKAALRKTMIYPIILGIVTIGVVVLMLIKVVPEFNATFEDMDAKMPAITQTIINMSNNLVSYWYIYLAVLAILVVGISMFGKSDPGKEFFGKLQLKIPVIRNVVVKSSAGLLGRTLDTLIAAGITLNEAVEITAKNINNVVIRKVLMDAKKEIERGVSLSDPLEASGVFPPMVYHMIRIGEKTGKLEDMLKKIADYYEDDVENATQSFMAILEPIIIVTLAVVIGTIMLSLVMPMMNIYNGVDKM